jgi:hypothetical protein
MFGSSFTESGFLELAGSDGSGLVSFFVSFFAVVAVAV